MDAVTRYGQHIIAEIRARQADPVGYADRERRQQQGEGQTLTITHYGENVSLSHRTAGGRDYLFGKHTNDEAETFALEALERQPLLTLVEIDKRPR